MLHLNHHKKQNARCWAGGVEALRSSRPASGALLAGAEFGPRPSLTRNARSKCLLLSLYPQNPAPQNQVGDDDCLAGMDVKPPLGMAAVAGMPGPVQHRRRTLSFSILDASSKRFKSGWLGLRRVECPDDTSRNRLRTALARHALTPRSGGLVADATGHPIFHFLPPAQQRLLAGRATTLSLPTSPLWTLDSTAGRLNAPLKLPHEIVPAPH